MSRASTKQQPTDWEKIFSNPTSDRGLRSNLYKELKKVDSLEPNNPIKKWGTELNKEFSTEEYRVAEKHLKKEMFNILSHQINENQNNTEILPSHQSEQLRSKTQVTADAGEDMEKYGGYGGYCWWDCKLVQQL